MQTIQHIRMEDASGLTRRIFDTMGAQRGTVSNMVKTMGQSPTTLEGYFQFSRALTNGYLSPRLRRQLALTVAQANHCDYSLAQHAALAVQLGLTSEEIQASCEASADDRKTDVALKFARNLVLRTGDCSTGQLRDAGFEDAEIIEIVGQVALNVFENYFNSVVQTEPDFPAQPQ